MQMTLEQLRIFVAVAEREHVTQAARDLNLTQSAVSAAVTTLEARFATKLFDRIGRRIELTEAGRLFLAEARAVLARAAEAETLLTDLAGMKRGSLAIAASQTVANYWLPPMLRRYRTAYPGVSVQLTIGNTETVAAMTREGLADVGLVEDRIEDPALAVTAIAEDELVLVVGAAHAATLPERPGPADLTAVPWVFRERGSGTRAILETTLAEMGIAPADLQIVLVLPSNESVRRAVEDGAGATVLSRMVVADAIGAGVLAARDLPLPKRRFLALRHKERHPTRAVNELCRMFAADCGGAGR